MKQAIYDLVQQNKLHQKIADKILKLSYHDQALLLNFIHKFRLGINYSHEFITYILDVIKRDQVKLSQLLKDNSLTAIADDPDLPHARQMELLRQFLRRIRFPYNTCGQIKDKAPLGSAKPFFMQQAFNKIYVAEGAMNQPMTQNILGYYKNSIVEVIGSAKELINTYSNINEGKKILVLARQKGKWLEHCPGTQGHICCNYLIINNGVNCPFDCTYCYLQSYVTNKLLVLYVNSKDLFIELDSYLERNTGKYLRIGTGEFTDSLVLDRVSGFSKELVEYFSNKENCILELKTKSAEVDHILNFDHHKKTIVGWSLNPEHIVKSQELGTAPLKNRLEAAQKCVTAGYDVAFHFDPIFFYDTWEKDYKEVVDAIFTSIPEKSIAWISLGALRFKPMLKDIIEARFPDTNITCQELDIAPDHKMRYFTPIRIEIFKKMHRFIRQYSRDILVYLCMESQEVWEKSGIRNNEHNAYWKYFKFCLKV